MSKSTVAVPVEMALRTAKLLHEASRSRSSLARLRRKKLEAAAIELEALVEVQSNGRVKVRAEVVRVALEGLTCLVQFRKEISKLANALMGRND